MFFQLLLTAAIFLGFSSFAEAGTYAVGSCTTYGTYPTITQAVESVPAGSVIEVCPGTYAEQIVITKRLTLKGVSNASGGDSAVIVPPATGLATNGNDIFGNPVAAQVFVASTDGAVTVEDLTIDGTGNNIGGCSPTLEGIYFQNTSGTITHNAVRNQYETDYTDLGGCQNGLAINVESTTSANRVTVSYNSVHGYQKNGITATGAATGPGAQGPDVTIELNYIVGLAATAMNWQGVYNSQATAAENGVQVGFGASGKVSSNTVLDNIWGQDTSSDTGDAASGILIYASESISVTANEVGSAQFGIVAVTDPVYGPADETTITTNKVQGTQIFDAIDVCSSSNKVTSNQIYGSSESGVHIDDSCGSGNSNTVTGNTINEACAGILLGSGSGNITTPNTYGNVTNTTLAGDVCPAPLSDVKTVSAKTRALRPSPYLAVRK
ncbi:MAG TPA: NosD domain-containing protein [Verrucomicrobiae bacterium]|nr:NosD domain-containing protein [Verrucomicrobiae bacterium]